MECRFPPLAGDCGASGASFLYFRLRPAFARSLLVNLPSPSFFPPPCPPLQPPPPAPPAALPSPHPQLTHNLSPSHPSPPQTAPFGAVQDAGGAAGSRRHPPPSIDDLSMGGQHCLLWPLAADAAPTFALYLLRVGLPRSCRSMNRHGSQPCTRLCVQHSTIVSGGALPFVTPQT